MRKLFQIFQPRLPSSWAMRSTIESKLKNREVNFKEKHVGIFPTSRCVPHSRMRKFTHFSLAEKIWPKQNVDRFDMLFARHDLTVIKLPPYMSNLSPTELAWRQIKDYVRYRNTTADMALTRVQGLKIVTNDDWAGHCSCVTNTEILIRGWRKQLRWTLWITS
jgi:hypothetical protein